MMADVNGTVPGYRGTPTAEWDPAEPTDIAQARDFLRQYYAEHPTAGTPEARLRQVEAEIAATGTYRHTSAELTFGARVAWRNASRCIGRLYWNSLLVLDRRESRTAEQIFSDIVEHLHVAAGNRSRIDAPPDVRPGSATPSKAGGKGESNAEPAADSKPEAPGQLRPTISIFPAAVPGRPYARIWNEQLIRYAGYVTPEGATIGDPRYYHFTQAMTARGWSGKGEAFDVLPLAIETPTDGVKLYELPAEAILEVPLEHPEHRWFAELGLRWHAIPAIANMRLDIGGVQYPAAPFNGWYMGAEIGARNLADEDRYNMLPILAARLGMDTGRDSTLWRDRALVELNVAVLWSFETAGIRISDHHTEARRFLQHIAREERAGRDVPADWSWIVPPISGGTTPVFHRYYPEADLRPGFYLDSTARDLGRFGEIRGTGVATAAACPVAAPPMPTHTLRAAVPPASVRRAGPDLFDEAEDEVSAA
jgi:nitric-oxide synthase, bacterial